MRNIEALEAELSEEDVVGMPDKDLYSLCKIYGNESRKWQRQFAFLLPEVARRGLHRKYGCESIYHFAAKTSAMGHGVTYRVLALHKKLQDKSLIWNHFRKFGWAKLRVIADVVKVDDQEFWLDKLERLPKMALEKYVRIFRNQGVNDLKNDLFSFVPGNETENIDYLNIEPKNCGALSLGDEVGDENSEENLLGFSRIQTYRKLKFNVSPGTEFEMKKLKMENKELKMVKGLKDKKSKEAKQRNENRVEVSRYIPVKIKEEIINKYHGKCAFSGCNEPFLELHHADRFSLVQNHENLRPLCRVHHQMMHAGVVDEVGEKVLWLGKGNEASGKFEKIDAKVRSFWNSG